MSWNVHVHEFSEFKSAAAATLLNSETFHILKLVSLRVRNDLQMIKPFCIIYYSDLILIAYLVDN